MFGAAHARHRPEVPTGRRRHLRPGQEGSEPVRRARRQDLGGERRGPDAPDRARRGRRVLGAPPKGPDRAGQRAVEDPRPARPPVAERCQARAGEATPSGRGAGDSVRPPEGGGSVSWVVVMRRLASSLSAVLLLLAACTAASGDPGPSTAPVAAAASPAGAAPSAHAGRALPCPQPRVPGAGVETFRDPTGTCLPGRELVAIDARRSASPPWSPA